jgi:hypothetical protein
MRIAMAQIYDKHTGLGNQIFTLIHRIIRAQKEKMNVLVVGDFLGEIHKMDQLHPIEDVLDMDHMRMLTYPLLVIGRRQWRISVEEASYGTDSARVAVPFSSDPGIRFEWDQNLHDLVGDPAVGHKKHLDILFRIGPHLITCSYPEGRSGHLVYPIRIRLGRFDFRFGWINDISQPLFDHFLSRLKFRPTIPYPVLPHSMVHVLHLRIEDDAIRHWSHLNRMTASEYRSRLINMYITKIQESMMQMGGCLLILSSIMDSPIHHFLREKGVPFFQQEKDPALGREEHALRDLLLAEQCCNSVLMINFDIPTMKGSSFSYMLFRRCTRATRTVFIDLDHVV